MDKSKYNTLSPNEIAFILIGIMLNINIAKLPNNLVKIAKQDAWISAAVGAIYPLYITLLVVYISVRFPQENIFAISQKYFGKIFGNVLNILFTISILSYLPAAFSQISIVVQNYVTTFISSLKIYTTIAVVASYCACGGLRVIKRICSINFCILVIIIIISLGALKEGSFLNVRPMLGVSPYKIVKASVTSAYDYSCIEIIFLLYPLINDYSKVKNAALKASAFICFMYTWITFICIYYLGIDVIPKTYWAFFSVTEDIKFIEIINFRYLILFFLIFISIKSISIFYYFAIMSINNIKKIKNKEMICFIISVFFIYICRKYYSNLLNRNAILNYTVPISIIYNLIYTSFIALLIFIKKDDENAK